MEFHQTINGSPSYNPKDQIISFQNRGQFFFEKMGNTAHKMNRDLSGQLKLHNVIVHKLLKALIYDTTTVGMVLVLNNEPGKGGQIGVGIGLFV